MLEYVVGILRSDGGWGGVRVLKYMEKNKLSTYVIVIPVCLNVCVIMCNCFSIFIQ